MPLVAYLLTFSTYGTHLPGSENGWIDGQHRIPGSPLLEPNPVLESYWRSRLHEAPFILEREERLLTLEAILSVCSHRQWTAYAVHVRSNHVHAVLSGEAKPERMLSACKAYATRAFRSRAAEVSRQRHWAKHGSTRYLWNAASLQAAIDYVLHGQGTSMARYPQKLSLGA